MIVWHIILAKFKVDVIFWVLGKYLMRKKFIERGYVNETINFTYMPAYIDDSRFFDKYGSRSKSSA